LTHTSALPDPHAVKPVPQPHVPLEHVSAPGHALPHAPQLSAFVPSATHAPLQSVRPLAHEFAHALSEQTWPPVQMIPQPPQFSGSEVVSTQSPLQVVPVVHTPPSDASVTDPSELLPSENVPSVAPSFTLLSEIASPDPASSNKSPYASRSVRPQPTNAITQQRTNPSSGAKKKALFMI
jgi:hypothetical protein